MKKKLIFLALFFAFWIGAGSVSTAYCQTTNAAAADEPKIYISQESADECARAVIERKELRALAFADKQLIRERDAIIEDLKVKLALSTGQLIGKDAEIARMTAIIEYLLKSTRKKKIGLINIF